MAKKIKDPRPSWDEYFMEIATVVSKRSNCMRRSVGAVVMKDNHILSTGYNGTPRGVKNCFAGGCPRCAATTKSGAHLEECLCTHAEQNAICQAAYYGNSIAGGTIYITISSLPHLREANHQLRHKGGCLWRRLCLHRQGEGDVQGGWSEA